MKKKLEWSEASLGRVSDGPILLLGPRLEHAPPLLFERLSFGNGEGRDIGVGSPTFSSKFTPMVINRHKARNWSEFWDLMCDVSEFTRSSEFRDKI